MKVQRGVQYRDRQVTLITKYQLSPAMAGNSNGQELWSNGQALVRFLSGPKFKQNLSFNTVRSHPSPQGWEQILSDGI